MRDPIRNPVRVFRGERRQVDVEALLSEIDLAPTPKAKRKRGQGQYGPHDADPSRRLLHVDPARRYELIEQLVKEIPSNLQRVEWVWFGHALQGAFGNPYAGEEIWEEFCNRWTLGDIDPEEDERVWDSLDSAGGRRGSAG